MNLCLYVFIKISVSVSGKSLICLKPTNISLVRTALIKRRFYYFFQHQDQSPKTWQSFIWKEQLGGGRLYLIAGLAVCIYSLCQSINAQEDNNGALILSMRYLRSHTGSHQDDMSPADSCNQVFSGFTIKSSHCSPICASISSSSVSYWCSCQEDPSLCVSARFNQLRFVCIHLIAQTLHVIACAESYGNDESASL